MGWVILINKSNKYRESLSRQALNAPNFCSDCNIIVIEFEIFYQLSMLKLEIIYSKLVCSPCKQSYLHKILLFHFWDLDYKKLRGCNWSIVNLKLQLLINSFDWTSTTGLFSFPYFLDFLNSCSLELNCLVFQVNI